MKKNKLLMLIAATAMLVACGGKQGKPNFGDNEYAVRTIGTQSAALETT